MLDILHIENIAIIEEAEIQFEPNFNVLSGETGAGKSIVIDAINAVLGQRTSREIIRTGSNKAYVSAIFNDVPKEIMVACNCDNDDASLFLERELFFDGKNNCRINGRPVNVNQLKNIGTRLLNIHGQHDGQQLLDEEQHLGILDLYADVDSIYRQYYDSYKKMSEIRSAISKLKLDELEKARKIDSLTFQISELEKANLKRGEEETLQDRKRILRNAEKYLSSISEADYLLNGNDSSQGAVSLVKQSIAALSQIRNINDDIVILHDRLNAIYSDLYDIADTISDHMNTEDYSDIDLDSVESRLDQIYRLKKKYGPTVDDMIEYLDKSKRELSTIEQADNEISILEKKYKEAFIVSSELALQLSNMRKNKATELSKLVLKELEELDMKKVQFLIQFTEKEMDDTGIDSVAFMMSANAGEDLRPISKIASGGELSRIMLALKNVLSSQDLVGTLIFDEIDTGVSGHAAIKVAEKIAHISRRKQVLCVTHLPQIASMADTHYSVKKNERDGRTYTEVQKLSWDLRCREIARLTGGSTITNTMISGAEELLIQAKNYKSSIK